MVRKKTKRKSPIIYRISLWLLLIAIVVAVIFLINLYNSFFTPSVTTNKENTALLYIPTGADFETVLSELGKKNLLTDKTGFIRLAKKKNYTFSVKPGRYRVTNGMSNNELLNMLRSGKQEPVRFMFTHVRSLKDLARIASDQLEPKQIEFSRYLLNDSVPTLFGFTKETFPAMFIPNTYEMYWNTDPEEFAKRMKREYIAFWAGSRSKKAEEIKLTRIEVSILASIVDQESLHDDENATIAGVFMNRIENGIPLQSDPTVIYAVNDFTIRRVLNVHRKIKSPYNTYLNRGLPPGPISIPTIAAIDAVLNYSSHNYLYFCAKPDLSGYHNFARTLSQHNENARSYHNALNRRKIFK